MQTSDDVLKLAKELLPEHAQEHFLRSLDDAKTKAQTMLDVKAAPYMQAGVEVLVGKCPACGMIAALSGEGRHQCRACHRWLRYIKP